MQKIQATSTMIMMSAIGPATTPAMNALLFVMGFETGDCDAVMMIVVGPGVDDG